MERKKDQIVFKTPEDALRTYEDGVCSVRLYVPAYGDKQINEVMDIVYYEKGCYVPYHYTDKGVQTLLILKGKVQVTLYAKTCECGQGDYINIPAHCPCSLRTLEEGCIIRAVYTGLHVAARYEELALLRKNALSQACREDFIKDDFDPAHGYFALTEPSETETVEKHTLAQITPKGRSIYEYNGREGICCRLKVGRWDLKRVKEIWEYTIDKGYQMQYLTPTQNESLYSVQSGKVKVETGGEVWIAEENDIIHVPVYTPFTLTALSEQTVVHDLNVSARLFRLLEMLELAQRDEPEKAKDPQWISWLLEMNDSNLTGFVKK